MLVLKIKFTNISKKMSFTNLKSYIAKMNHKFLTCQIY